jgi:hypothetical protein
MMKRRKFALNGNYVFTRGERVNGVQYGPGDAVPSGEVNPRALRLLYDQRRVDYADADKPVQKEKVPQVGENNPSFEPEKMTLIATQIVSASEEWTPPSDMPIPDDWRNQHWRTRQKLAEQLTGTRPTNGDEANELIEQAEAQRNA